MIQRDNCYDTVSFKIYFKTGSGRADGTNAQLMVYFGKNCHSRVCQYTKERGFTHINYDTTAMTALSFHPM